MVSARLIDVAIAEFGSKGLDGASTRGIAAKAGTAMSSITYHYGGKDGLYLAVADHIGEQMALDMGDLFDPDDVVTSYDPAGARDKVQRVLAHFTDKMAHEASDGWAMFIVREQMHPTAAFDRLYAGAMGRMLRMLVELVCAATGLRDRQAAAIATVTMFGQVLALRSSRATCLRLIDVGELTGPVLEAVKRRIAANTDAMLDRLTVEPKGA